MPSLFRAARCWAQRADFFIDTLSRSYFVQKVFTECALKYPVKYDIIIVPNEREVEHMTIKQLPMIYNVDKIRVYVKNGLVAELWVGQMGISWYYENDDRLKPFLDRKVEELSISIDGCLSETVVLEIFYYKF